MDEMWTDITSVNIARVVDRVAGRFIAVPFAILLAVSFLAGGIGVPLGLLYLLARFITWAGTSN
jgi:hypothetical protein